MGVSLSFLAIKGAAPADIHRALGVTDTGVASPEDEDPIPSVRGAALPTGWYLVLLDHVVHRLIKSRAILTGLSRGCEVIACQIEEHDMYSGCFGLHDGELVWSVVHNSNEGRDHLKVRGEPPAALAEITARLRREEAQHQPGPVGVDYIIDIPLELAASFCGYRHDMPAEWGEPAFTILAEGESR
jgi:hypothetical protein